MVKHRTSSPFVLVVAVVTLALVVLAVFQVSTVRAAPIQRSTPARPLTTDVCPDGSAGLCWHGGPVQVHPKVHLILWGSQWQSPATGSVLLDLKTGLPTLFKYMAGGEYTEILTQYYGDANDPTKYVHNDTIFTGDKDWWVDSTDPPSSGVYFDTNATCGSIVNTFYCEARHALSNNASWSITPDTQFLVLPQPNTKIIYSTPACGAHQFVWPAGAPSPVIFGYVATEDLVSPDYCVLDTQRIESDTTHEFAEAVTDPQLNAWCKDGASHCEIADLCGNSEAYPNYDNIHLGYGVTQTDYYVTELWDDSQNGCAYVVHGSEYETSASPTSYYTVKGRIYDDYQSVGGPSSQLGVPTSEEMPVPGAGGSPTVLIRQSNFQNGSIYYKSATGAHEVQGDIYKDYVSGAIGGPTGKLGFPTSDEGPFSYGSTSGRVSDFEGTSCTQGDWTGTSSAIFWSQNTPASELQGCIYQRFKQDTVDLSSFLGFPTSNEQDVNGGTANTTGAYNTFAGTSCTSGPYPSTGSGLYWWSGEASFGAVYVRGCIYADYVKALGGPTGKLGFPTSDELDGVSGTYGSGDVSYFSGTNCTVGPWQHSGSAIYWSSGTANSGAGELQGCIFQRYINDSALGGGPSGFLGFPTSNEIDFSGGAYNTFQGTNCTASGYVGSGSALYWNAANAAVYFVRGCIYQAYLEQGLQSSWLGLPTANEIYISATSEYESVFTNGCIYYQPALQDIIYEHNLANCQ